MSLKENLCRTLSRKRKGASIVENIILMIVLSITIAAIVSTMTWVTKLQASARNNIGQRIMASNWFAAFEALDPNTRLLDFGATSQQIARLLDPYAAGNVFSGFSVSGYKIKPEVVSVPSGKTNYGVNAISLTVSSLAERNVPFSIVKRVNKFSAETVSDDRKGA